MQFKEFQIRVLDNVNRWHDALDEARSNSEELVKILAAKNFDTAEASNYPKNAWSSLANNGHVTNRIEYVSRTDGAGRPIPHACLKVPTGGGKTILAAEALNRLKCRRGLILWIVPSEAIFAQTKKALRTREHHVRKRLELASGGHVKVLEKDDGFTELDLQNYLCVMLLMLPATNRTRNKQFLRMFRNAGKYAEFFPDDDDRAGNDMLDGKYPDLEIEEGMVVKSLANVFKMKRPVIVLDEAHKAYGKSHGNEYAKSISSMDPRLVLEMSATPNPGISNLLVNVTGTEMAAEEMIKMPVELNCLDLEDWKQVLENAKVKLAELGEESLSLHADSGRYTRPIAVVRAERTGKDKRDGMHVHAEDVRDHLVKVLGVPRGQIAVKSSDNDEISGIDLMSSDTEIRWIITKSALMEGWDCPFAYVLVILDNFKSEKSLTQLLGRILRQPDTSLTNRESLDKCYVFCHHEDTDSAMQYVKNGLAAEGMGDIMVHVPSGGSTAHAGEAVVERREGLGNNIFMPKVLHRDGRNWIELDYRRHILSKIDWDAITMPDFDETAESAARWHGSVIDPEGTPKYIGASDINLDRPVRLEDFARSLSDVVPNPWRAARYARRVLDGLRDAGKADDYIHKMQSHIRHHIRTCMESAISVQAEKVFRNEIQNRTIRFDLEVEERNFKLRDRYVVKSDGVVFRNKGERVQKTLFDTVYDDDFDTNLERSFAKYLDGEKAIRWWHRVAARQLDEYYIRGWEKNRIWPDIIAMTGENKGETSILIYETKGEFLSGSEDTEYKEKVLKTLEDAFNCGMVRVRGRKLKGVFKMIFDKHEFADALEPSKK